MKSNYAKNVGGRLLTLLAILLFALYSGTASAQSGNLILTQGNVNIYQNADGWVIYHGNAVIAHGEGTLDITDLPPAFQDFLDYYAALSLDKSPKKKLSKDAPTPVQYGPLLRTQWNQTPPWNNMCPTIDLGAGSSEQSVIGCVSITSGQLLNYYKYCNAITVTSTSNTYNGHTYGENTYSKPFTKTNNSLLSANGTVTIEGETHYKYIYSIDGYQPNFDEINVDDNKLAEFMITLAVVQGADFDVSKNGGTGTTYVSQMNAMNDLYGYDAVYYDLHDANNKDNCYLSYGDRIKTAIEQGWPIIIRGQKNTDGSGGHSFMVDGIKGSEFHINYGWGGNGDGWFTEEATYKYDMGVLVAHPKNDNFVGMKASPASVHISGNGVNKTIEMVATGNGLEFRQDGDVELPAGEYEFYFEYSDETKIAPYSESTIALTKEYSRLGYFVSTPAKFSIAGEYKVNFLHIQDKGEIKLECADYDLTISGKVLDETSKGVAGVMIYASENKPINAIDQQNDAGTDDDQGKILSTPKQWSTNSFIPTNSLITQVDFKARVKGTPTGNFHVAIFDKLNNKIWEKELTSNQLAAYGWNSIKLENFLNVTPGAVYNIGVSADSYEENNYYGFRVDDANEKLQFKIWSVTDYCTFTKDDGSYSLNVEKGFSGKLNAYSDDYCFTPMSLSNVTKPITNMDFVALSKYITISGKVLNSNGDPIEGAFVAATESAPTITVGSQCSTDYAGFFYSYQFNDDMLVSSSFKLNDNYLSAVDVYVWKTGTPSNLVVSILDENENVLDDQTVNVDEVSTTTKSWLHVEFDKEVKLISGNTYYIGLSTESNTDESSCYKYGVASTKTNGNINNDMFYKAYTTATFLAKSTSTGAYQYEAERYSTFTLNAFTDDDKDFNSFEFTNLADNATERNFIENATITKYGALTLTEIGGTKTAVIDGSSDEEVNITAKIENVSSVKYERKFTKNQCATIMLPFEFNTSDFTGGTFHTLSNVSYNSKTNQWEATLSPEVTGTIKANTPYIFQPTSNTTSVTFSSNVTIEKTEAQSNINSGWALVGVYKRKDWTEKSPNQFGFAATNESATLKAGDFARFGKGAWLPPLRCYLEYQGDISTLSKSATELPERIVVIFADKDDEQPQNEVQQVVEEGQPLVELSETDDFATPVSELVSNKDVKVWSFDKTIFIESAAGQDYVIIDANGRMLRNSVTTSNRDEVVLNRQSTGIVIVRIANKSFKLKY